MKLFNRKEGKVLKNQMERTSEKRLTISYYNYCQINTPQFFRDHLYYYYNLIGVLGRIYVSKEGINAQISFPLAHKSLLEALHDDIDYLSGLRLNAAIEDDGKSFFKLKILVRDKIVSDGITDPTFNPSEKGKYLNAEQFNTLVSKKNTVLIDMRNHYESEIGHFKNAWTPDVDTFRESLPKIVDAAKDKKNKTIVMYCTGGIRCEKASAYLKHKGFDNVYHLEGGIIEYTRQVKALQLENKFIGKNFVFDERLAETISEEVIANCHQCGNPFDVHTNCVNEACHLLFIQCTDCKTKFNNCCCSDCKDTHALPKAAQKALRKGKPSKRNIFKKGRSLLPFAPKPNG